MQKQKEELLLFLPTEVLLLLPVNEQRDCEFHTGLIHLGKGLAP
jgi:hypothetical protein